MHIIKGQSQISPADAGYEAAQITALEKHFARLMDEGILQAGEYALARHGKTFARGALGRLKYDDAEEPLVPDTPFGVASITKIVVTVAIMKLVEAGTLSVYSKLKDICPEFDRPGYDEMTIYHLLTHTSGLVPDPGGFPDIGEQNYYALIAKYIDAHDAATDGAFNWLDAAFQIPPRREPDVEWIYSSFGFAILGEVISRITQTDCHRFILEEIAKPLGMNDTMFELTPELARRHIVKNIEMQAWLADIKNGRDGRSETDKLWDQIPQTGGGLTSTLGDLLKFGNMCLNMGRLGDTRIVGRKTFEHFTSRTLYNVPQYMWGAKIKDRAYGLGFDMKRMEYTYSPGSFFHEGAGGCALLMDPTEGMVAAYHVPFGEKAGGWSAEAVYNTQNIIWGGII